MTKSEKAVVRAAMRWHRWLRADKWLADYHKYSTAHDALAKTCDRHAAAQKKRRKAK